MIQDDNTYIGEDGITYCSVCNEPRELLFNVKLYGKIDRVAKMCRCQIEKEEKEERERKERVHWDTVRRNKSICFHEKRMQEWTFENNASSDEAVGSAKAFVEHWDDVCNERAGLLFWGGVGTGKTYLAACIANALLEEEKRVLMTDFASVANVSTFEAKEYFKSLVSYDLLIIDDLGAERNSEFAMQNVFDVINRRWESGRPLIVTTNMDMNDMKRSEDLAKIRIYDRILDMCTPILLTGGSRRQESAQCKKRFWSGIFNQRNDQKKDQKKGERKHE